MVDFRILPADDDEKVSVPIGVHESEDWNKGKAVQLVKRAAMHYYKSIFDSAKAGSYEAISNIPTWVMAVKQPTPGILTSAVGGTTLTASFAGESLMNFFRFNRTLGILEEFDRNRHSAETRREAADILERRVHGEGLLFENIPLYDLKDYPEKKFEDMMEARRLFTNKGELKKRIESVSEYLRTKPADAALSALKLPFTITFGAMEMGADVLKGVVGDGVSNIFRPSKFKEIMQGLISIPKVFYHSNVWPNTPRHKVQQKPFYSALQEGTLADDHIARTTITADDIAELQKTRNDMKNNIALQKIEAGRYAAEGFFIGGHVVEAAQHFNAESLQSGELTPDNIKLGLSVGSIMMAWEPFAHIGKNLKNLVITSEGHRSIDIQQYEKVNRQIEMAQKAQESEARDMDHS